MCSAKFSFILGVGAMVLTGAARSVTANLFYQLGFNHALFLTLLYLIGQALNLIPYNIMVLLKNRGYHLVWDDHALLPRMSKTAAEEEHDESERGGIVASLDKSKSKDQEAESQRRKFASEVGEILFRQPDSTHEGDCPICCLPIPIDPQDSTMMFCCSKLICNGCQVANELREQGQNLKSSCLFCRQPRSFPQEESVKETDLLKRIKVNDPIAMHNMGKKRYKEGYIDEAFKYWEGGASLGEVGAHYELGLTYLKGEGGVEKDLKKGLFHMDLKKALFHMEKAAIGGHPAARYNLGVYDYNLGWMERAVKHFIIAATLGCVDSIDVLKKCYVHGDVSKEDFASVLRAHQAAVDATKSPQRKAAYEFIKRQRATAP